MPINKEDNPQGSSRVSLWCQFSSVMCIPLAWTIWNLATIDATSSNETKWAAPLSYLITMTLLTLVVVGFALISSKVRWSHIGRLVLIVQLSGLFIVVSALCIPLIFTGTRVNTANTSYVTNPRVLTKFRNDLTDDELAAGNYFMIHSWEMNVFGRVLSSTNVSSTTDYTIDEFGLPFRFIQAPSNFWFPPSDNDELFRAMPKLLTGMRISPAPFAINTLLVTNFILGIIFVPKLIRCRLRLQGNRCANCGFTLYKTSKCSECGTKVDNTIDL